uniref:DNA2/NAM7 helicase-like C-terminal domain-containing protein n=1 Tax=Romanomermis culicivorax TaxID=13658 RepID=A0A915IQ83_ROMCU
MMTGYPIAWIHIVKEESANDNSRSMQNIGEGQESDIVIYDIVRSNQYLTIKFLENFECLNITIGLAECLLIVIGKATMFPLLDLGKCFIVNKDQINTKGRQHWCKLVE